MKIKIELVALGSCLLMAACAPLASLVPIDRREALPEVTAENVARDAVVRGAWYELAFTQPTLSGRPEGPSPAEQLLVQLIDRAQQTLDVAIHDLDLESVTDALTRAHERGVRVRVVLESELARSAEPFKQAAVRRLSEAGIPFVQDRPNGTMHHKFTVADGRWVQTGSWNYTFSETYRNNNNVIVIESRELAANFTAEFEKMFVNRQFGNAKTRGVPHPTLSLAGARAENYFSPSDRPAAPRHSLDRGDPAEGAFPRLLVHPRWDW